METITGLPESKRTFSQKKTYSKMFTENGKDYRIVVNLQYDDECKNGHNTFSATADIYRGARWESGGCQHEEIAKHFPEYAKYIKWHLTSSDGPMHYIANTIFLAGDKDCWGLRKGEFRQRTSRGKYQNNGIEGVPNWKLRISKDIPTDVYAHEKPAPVTIEWEPQGMTGEGKERELDSARRAAVWPEATDEELTAPDLKERLIARLPALMQEFKKDMEELGFIY